MRHQTQPEVLPVGFGVTGCVETGEDPTGTWGTVTGHASEFLHMLYGFILYSRFQWLLMVRQLLLTLELFLLLLIL